MNHMQVLTVGEVAVFLRRPRSSIYELVRCGRLVAVRDGPKLLKFRKSDVDAYLLANLTSSKNVADTPICSYIKARRPLPAGKAE